jgi:hypothetical protein
VGTWGGLRGKTRPMGSRRIDTRVPTMSLAGEKPPRHSYTERPASQAAPRGLCDPNAKQRTKPTAKPVASDAPTRDSRQRSFPLTWDFFGGRDPTQLSRDVLSSIVNEIA